MPERGSHTGHEGLRTLPEIAERLGAEYRTLQSWVERGLVAPTVESDGAGTTALYDQDAVSAVWRLVGLRKAGLSVEGLERVVGEPDRLREDLDRYLDITDEAWEQARQWMNLNSQTTARMIRELGVAEARFEQALNETGACLEAERRALEVERRRTTALLDEMAAMARDRNQQVALYEAAMNWFPDVDWLRFEESDEFREANSSLDAGEPEPRSDSRIDTRAQDPDGGFDDGPGGQHTMYDEAAEARGRIRGGHDAPSATAQNAPAPPPPPPPPAPAASPLPGEDERPTGVVLDGETRTVCNQRDHEWAEGDNRAVYCATCTGHRCYVCEGRGAVDRRKCYACSGFGVEMWWEPEQRFINPRNWAAVSSEQRDECFTDEDCERATHSASKARELRERAAKVSEQRDDRPDREALIERVAQATWNARCKHLDPWGAIQGRGLYREAVALEREMAADVVDALSPVQLPGEPSEEALDEAWREWSSGICGEGPPSGKLNLGVLSFGRLQKLAKVLYRVDAQPVEPDAGDRFIVGRRQDRTLVVRKIDSDEWIALGDLMEARAEVERLKEARRGLSKHCHEISRELYRVRAARPLSTDVLRNPPDWVLAVIASDGREVDADEEAQWRDELAGLADVLDEHSPSLPDPDVDPGWCSERLSHVGVGDGPNLLLFCELRTGHAGDHQAGETRWGPVPSGEPGLRLTDEDRRALVTAIEWATDAGSDGLGDAYERLLTLRQTFEDELGERR